MWTPGCSQRETRDVLEPTCARVLGPGSAWPPAGPSGAQPLHAPSSPARATVSYPHICPSPHSSWTASVSVKEQTIRPGRPASRRATCLVPGDHTGQEKDLLLLETASGTRPPGPVWLQALGLSGALEAAPLTAPTPDQAGARKQALVGALGSPAPARQASLPLACPERRTPSVLGFTQTLLQARSSDFASRASAWVYILHVYSALVYSPGLRPPAAGPPACPTSSHHLCLPKSQGLTWPGAPTLASLFSPK